MKNLFLRSSVALACVLSLASCGGGGGNLLLGGYVGGLTKDGLTLTNNGGTPLTVPANSSSFQFPDLLKPDEHFDVEIATHPEGTTCTLLYNSGKTGAYSVTNIEVHCANDPRNITGKIVNPPVNAGLILINGANQQPIAAGQTTFSMTHYDTAGKVVSGQVGDGDPFGVTVLQQPAGQTCTVQNGTGYAGHVDYTAVLVTCANN